MHFLLFLLTCMKPDGVWGWVGEGQVTLQILSNTGKHTMRVVLIKVIRGRYHEGRRPSSDDNFHSPTVLPPSALDKPSLVKR